MLLARTTRPWLPILKVYLLWADALVEEEPACQAMPPVRALSMLAYIYRGVLPYSAATARKADTSFVMRATCTVVVWVRVSNVVTTSDRTAVWIVIVVAVTEGMSAWVVEDVAVIALTNVSVLTRVESTDMVKVW
jgi:hypothetical protein